LQGRVRFTPKREITINGIQWSVTCVEKCVSGTGSNKTTHRCELLNRQERLAEHMALRAGQPQSFQFAFQLPQQAQPSLKFKENELTWTGEVRIDIPKWPDWVKSFPLTVVPSAASAAAMGSQLAEQNAASNAPLSEEEAWFDEVVRQVMQSRGDMARMQTVVNAVGNQVFSLRASLLEPLDNPPRSASRERGEWMLAYYERQDEELCLLWPAPHRPPAEHVSNWHGKAVIIGFDEEFDSLLMRVEKS
jgi:hypothetical protein